MDNIYIDRETAEFEERRKARAARRAEHARQQREREKKIKKYMAIAGGSFLAVIAGVVFLIHGLAVTKKAKAEPAGDGGVSRVEEVDITQTDAGEDPRNLLYSEDSDLIEGVSADAADPAMKALTDEELAQLAIDRGEVTGLGQDVLNVTPDDKTEAASAGIDSGYAIIVSLSENRVLTAREPHARMYPASMTKVMTVLVASDQLSDAKQLDDRFTITQAIEAFSYEHGCSNVGFSEGETVRVADLFYGTILPSGADAAMGLAEYTAGDQESFVALMNKKCEELGISDSTHFTNCIGIYDDDHYSTAADMAVIMNEAIKDPLCLEFLSAHTYTTSSTYDHPDGIMLSNWFLRRIEDKQETGRVVCGKTGFVKESLNCAVSYGTADDGTGYICCTGYAHGGWKAIYDHVNLYTKYFDPAGYKEPEAPAVEETGESAGDD